MHTVIDSRPLPTFALFQILRPIALSFVFGVPQAKRKFGRGETIVCWSDNTLGWRIATSVLQRWCAYVLNIIAVFPPLV